MVVKLFASFREVAAMSRLTNTPVALPKGVDINISGQKVSVKGSKGALEHTMHAAVQLDQGESGLMFRGVEGAENAVALAGTTRAIVKNMLTGVSDGFSKKLQLIGVGYRAQAKGQVLNLSLGYSHPIDYAVPEGITVETPSQTEVVVSGIDRQKVGQTAAEIRAFRPPEPYKGKGVRYVDEHVVRKEAKKK